jgi:hypothetical protein
MTPIFLMIPWKWRDFFLQQFNFFVQSSGCVKKILPDGEAFAHSVSELTFHISVGPSLKIRHGEVHRLLHS